MSMEIDEFETDEIYIGLILIGIPWSYLVRQCIQSIM